MIELFTASTPDGIKIPIALEELGVPYELNRIKLGSSELRSAAYLRINPNAKIPAIRHRDGAARCRQSHRTSTPISEAIPYPL